MPARRALRTPIAMSSARVSIRAIERDERTCLAVNRTGGWTPKPATPRRNLDGICRCDGGLRPLATDTNSSWPNNDLMPIDRLEIVPKPAMQRVCGRRIVARAQPPIPQKTRKLQFLPRAKTAAARRTVRRPTPGVTLPVIGVSTSPRARFGCEGFLPIPASGILILF